MILDDHAAEIFAKNINMMVPYYLMASYAYYVEDDPIFTDGFYDNLSKTILAVWDSIEHHHKHILTTDMLEAGSFIGEYPSIVSGALESLREQNK
jgi:NAD-dependent DNA ligase